MKRLFTQRPSRRSGWWLMVPSVVLCLVAGEFFGRAISPTASVRLYPNYIKQLITRDVENEAHMRYDATLGFEPKPGLVGTLRGKKLTYSAEGLRNHNVGSPAPTGPVTLALGDSYTEGYNVADDETWPAALQRLTDRRVLNAGLRGYGIDQMILRAEKLAPVVQPATLVLAFIPDDIDRTEVSIRDHARKPYFVLEGDGIKLTNVPVPTTQSYGELSWWRRIVGYSYLLDFTMRRLGLHEEWYGVTDRVHRDGLEVSCRLMKRFADFAKSIRADALVVALPEDSDWIDAKYGKRDHERVTYVLGCAARVGLPILDTWESYSSSATDLTTYYASHHFTPRGNLLAAQLVAAALERRGK